MRTTKLSSSYSRRRSLSPVRPLLSGSSSASDESLQKIRENNLIDRFNELYSHDRLNAMDTLRTVSDDYEMNQRICFNIVQVKQRIVPLKDPFENEKHFE